MTPRYSNLESIQADLRSGSMSCTELVSHYLEQAESSKELNAFVEIYADDAKAKAEEIDQRLAADPSQLGRCFGMVISVKDNICQKDKEVTAASGILEGFVSLYSATALQRLIDEDAIVIGRTNCDQFGMGSTNENSVYGPVKNADNPEYIAGGSSGGAAVSVQADCCLLAVGSDTGGSIRQPAAFCGLLGFKPSYGTISRYGLLAYASSFDQIGFIARSAKDIALALEISAGPDEMDASMLQEQPVKYTEAFAEEKKNKIAVLSSALNHPAMDPVIKNSMIDFIDELKAQDYEIEEVELDLLDYIVPAYYTLTTAEASANLSRYDGVRYGQRVEGEDLNATYANSRTAGFSEEVKKRILLGTFVLSAGYYEAYYGKAQKLRALLVSELDKIFQSCDYLLLPVSPVPAWKIGKKISDPTEIYLTDIFTVLANLIGAPAISIPLKRYETRTPYGLQMLAARGEEKKLLNLTLSLKPISIKFSEA